MDGYVFISESYADILTYDSAAVRFEGNRALSGGAITVMRNVQVDGWGGERVLPGGEEGGAITVMRNVQVDGWAWEKVLPGSPKGRSFSGKATSLEG